MTKDKVVSLTFILGCLTGSFCFFLLYGYEVVNPYNIGWFKNYATDPYQHYLGWYMFNMESWQWPLGKIANLLSPWGHSVVYMDAIPWFAIPAKFICHILNIDKNVQWFGLYGLICFSLQGGFSALILKKYISSVCICVIGTVLYIYSDPFIIKMFGHTALAGGQCIVLSAFVCYLYADNFSKKEKVFFWSIVCSVAMCNHPYIGLMVGSIFIFYILQNISQNKRDSVLQFVVTFAVTSFAFYVSGGFMGDGNDGTNLYGQASLNLNSLFNSYGCSRLFSALESANIFFPGEGRQFLGAGIICFLPIAILKLIYDIKNKTIIINKYIIFYSVVLFFISLSNYIYWGDILVFHYELPNFIAKKLAIFRSSGRLFWPVYYIIITFVLVNVWRIKKDKRLSGILVIAILCLQIWDSFPFLSEYSDAFKKRYEISDISLKNKSWEYAMYDVDEIDTFTMSSKDGNTTLRLVELAAIYNKSIDTTYGSHVKADELTKSWRNDMQKYMNEYQVPQKHIFIPLTKHILLSMLPYITNDNSIGFTKDGYLCFKNKANYINGPDVELLDGIAYSSLEDYFSKISEDTDKLCMIVAGENGVNGLSANDADALKKYLKNYDTTGYKGYSLVAIIDNGMRNIVDVNFSDGIVIYDFQKDDHTFSLRSCSKIQEYRGKYEDTLSKMDGKEISPQPNGIIIYIYDKKLGRLTEVAYFNKERKGMIIPFRYLDMLAL